METRQTSGPKSMQDLEMRMVGAQENEIFHRLIQMYEAEFSALTHKQANANGFFDLDTQIDITGQGFAAGQIRGFLAFTDSKPVGLAAILCHQAPLGTGNQGFDAHYEICEFYILPVYRKSKMGLGLAHQLWTRYPGRWTIKQIDAAEGARSFWLRTIQASQAQELREIQKVDPYWGAVYQQDFII